MYKQAIVLRKDLKMGKGKMAAQAAHASLSAAMNSERNVLEKWFDDGAKKVVLKVSSEKDIRALEKVAKKEKLVCSLIKDAGKTQIEKGSVTALAIGPAKESEVNKVTGKLKLL